MPFASTWLVSTGPLTNRLSSPIGLPRRAAGRRRATSAGPERPGARWRPPAARSRCPEGVDADLRSTVFHLDRPLVARPGRSAPACPANSAPGGAMGPDPGRGPGPDGEQLLDRDG